MELNLILFRDDKQAYKDYARGPNAKSDKLSIYQKQRLYMITRDQELLKHILKTMPMNWYGDEEFRDLLTSAQRVNVAVRALERNDQITYEMASKYAGGHMDVDKKAIEMAFREEDPFDIWLAIPRKLRTPAVVHRLRKKLKPEDGRLSPLPHPRAMTVGNTARSPKHATDLRSSCAGLYKFTKDYENAKALYDSLQAEGDLQNAALLVSCLMIQPNHLIDSVRNKIDDLGALKGLRRGDSVSKRLRLYGKLKLTKDQRANNSFQGMQAPLLPMIFKSIGFLHSASCANISIEEWEPGTGVHLDGSHFRAVGSNLQITDDREAFFLLAFSTLYRHVQYGQLLDIPKDVEAVRKRICPLYTAVLKDFPKRRRRLLANFALARCPP
jgi:hypothetical protein